MQCNRSDKVEKGDEIESNFFSIHLHETSSVSRALRFKTVIFIGDYIKRNITGRYSLRIFIMFTCAYHS